MMKARNDIKKAMKKNQLRKQEYDYKSKQKRTSTNNVNKTNNLKKEKNDELKRKIEVTNNEVSLERTNDILKQINEYIDKEKKNIE